MAHKKAPTAYTFDDEYLKRTKKDDFLKAHDHLKDLPLSEIWEKANKK